MEKKFFSSRIFLSEWRQKFLHVFSCKEAFLRCFNCKNFRRSWRRNFSTKKGLMKFSFELIILTRNGEKVFHFKKSIQVDDNYDKRGALKDRTKFHHKKSSLKNDWWREMCVTHSGSFYMKNYLSLGEFFMSRKSL